MCGLLALENYNDINNNNIYNTITICTLINNENNPYLQPLTEHGYT